MDGTAIVRQFERMGARASVATLDAGVSALRLDLARDRHGQFFDIRASRHTEVKVVDVREDMRHLLLLSVSRNGDKEKFLCGHDEREWFVAAVPGPRGVSSVVNAMEALKPPLVRFEQERRGVRHDRRTRRRTEAYVRQGEWFFLPRPGFEPPRGAVFRNEPMRRGAGKPHFAELAYREGGELVYVSVVRPNGVTEAERAMLMRRPKLADVRWTPMRRNPQMFVKGRISHPHHATITLDCWHLVQMNTEHQAPAMRHVAFLD
jgi:hypothetical protein